MNNREFKNKKSVFVVKMGYRYDRVTEEDKEDNYLLRIFDIEDEMIIPVQVKDGDRCFDARDRILFDQYYMTKFSDFTWQEGDVGVFLWSALENTNNPDKDKPRLDQFYKGETTGLTNRFAPRPKEKPSTPQESQKVIAEYIKGRATKKSFTATGVAKQSVNIFWDFLKDVGAGSIYDDIASKCQCTCEEAKIKVDEFLENANSYYLGSDMDTAFLSNLVEQNIDLCQRFKTLVKESWEKENADNMAMKAAEFTAHNEKCTSIQARVNVLKNEKHTLTQSLETLRIDIATSKAKVAKQTQVAENTAMEIQRKLASARGDVASFMADLAIYSPKTSRSPDHSNMIMELPRVYPSHEVVCNVDDLISWIGKNLGDAGTKEAHTQSLAKYLYACYDMGVSLLLAGPGGRAIADAYSSGQFARPAARIFCDGPWDQRAVARVIQSDAEVVVIQNPFHPQWIAHLPDVIFQSHKIFFLLTPFKEDLMVEPQGLYQYILPLFTESLIVDKPTGDYVFAKMKSTGNIEKQAVGKYHLDMQLPGMLDYRVERVLGTFQELQGRSSEACAKQYCLNPLLAVLGRTSEIEKDERRVCGVV